MESTMQELKDYSIRDLRLLKDFYKYLRPYAVRFFVLIFLDLFVNAAFTLEPVLFRFLLNALSDFEHQLIPVASVVRTGILVIALDFSLMLFALVGAYFINVELKKIGQAVIYDLRRDLFDHILALSTRSIRSMKIGSFVTRVTNDTQNLSLIFTDILPTLLRSGLTLLLILVMVFALEGFYGFLYLAYIPVVFLISYAFRKKARFYYRGEKRSISMMNSFLSESFSGIDVIKSYGREERMEKSFDRNNDSIYHAFLHSQNLFSVFYPFMYLLQMSCVLIVLGFGIPSVLSARMQVGDFQMLYSYSTQFFGPIQQATQQMNTMQQVFSSAERIHHVLSMREEKDEERGGIDVERFLGKVEFRHVYFAYVGEEYVLKDVSFVIEKGRTAAFVGATGAGKSTIIQLLCRTYTANKGEILIDGIDVRDYSLSCLRRNIGIMLQDVFLFSGTVLGNITLGDEKVSLEDAVTACREVGADAFIRALPHGYDEKVLERGDNFSAGQRQLLSFARTLVYKPSLILLDEATANIDTETEKTIQDSLERMRRIGTMVVVAHRLSTIKRADVIFVVDRGRIAESGDHQSLLKKRGIYYNLYRLQNMKDNLGKENAHEDNDQAL